MSEEFRADELAEIEKSTETIDKANYSRDDEHNSNEFSTLSKRVKKLEILSFIIIGLLSIFLIFTSIIVFNPSQFTKMSSYNQKKLPKYIDKAVANETINKIKDYYNNHEVQKLYNVLGEYARTLVTYDDFVKSIDQVNIVGEFISASYTDYTYIDSKNGADWFVLNYVAKYDRGNGNATVTIKVNGDEWEVVGFKFNFNS